MTFAYAIVKKDNTHRQYLVTSSIQLHKIGFKQHLQILYIIIILKVASHQTSAPGRTKSAEMGMGRSGNYAIWSSSTQ